MVERKMIDITESAFEEIADRAAFETMKEAMEMMEEPVIIMALGIYNVRFTARIQKELFGGGK